MGTLTHAIIRDAVLASDSDLEVRSYSGRFMYGRRYPAITGAAVTNLV